MPTKAGLLKKPLQARNSPPPSFRRKPESIPKRNDNTPAFHLPVIGGNQSENKKQRQNTWIPACAGMTGVVVSPEGCRSDNPFGLSCPP